MQKEAIIRALLPVLNLRNNKHIRFKTTEFKHQSMSLKSAFSTKFMIFLTLFLYFFQIEAQHVLKMSLNFYHVLPRVLINSVLK